MGTTCMGIYGTNYCKPCKHDTKRVAKQQDEQFLRDAHLLLYMYIVHHYVPVNSLQKNIILKLKTWDLMTEKKGLLGLQEKELKEKHALHNNIIIFLVTIPLAWLLSSCGLVMFFLFLCVCVLKSKQVLILCTNLFEQCPQNTFVFILNLLQCFTSLKQQTYILVLKRLTW